MASITIVTDLNVKEALRTVKNIAKDLDFAVSQVDDLELLVTKGNLFVSILAGAFVAYCKFHVFIEEGRDRIRIVIKRNSPWWTGIIGVNRVKSLAKKLADGIEDEIEEQGGNLYDSKET